MRLTIAHKIIISVCGVLAFAFLNSAFAIYSEYTAAKTSERIGKNYINAYQQMETLSLNTLTLQVNVLSYAASLNENFYNNAQNLIQALRKNADDYKAFVTTPENKKYYIETNKIIAEHHELVYNFTQTILDNLALIKSNTETMKKMNTSLDSSAATAQQLMKTAAQAGINQEYITRLNNIYSLSTLIKTASYMAVKTKQPDMLKTIPDNFNRINNMASNLVNNIDNKNITDAIKIIINNTNAAQQSYNQLIDIAAKMAALEKVRFQYAAQIREMNTQLGNIVYNLVKTSTDKSTFALKQGMLASVIFFFITFLTGAVGVAYLYFSVIKQLKGFVTNVEDLTKGDGDLTVRLSAKNKDELNDLAVSFNAFIKNVQEIVSEVKEAAGEVASGNNQLSATMEELAASFASQSEQISDMAGNIQDIRELSQASSVQLKDCLVVMNRSQDMTKAGAAQLDYVKTNVLDIQDKTSSLSATIDELSASSSKIGNILTVINDIASQTNLLALNAAIEAARAGEAGRGFAVVADEVRKLAERTQHSTGEIESIITSFQQESSRASKEMASSGEAVTSGVDMIGETASSFSNVVKGVNEAVSDTESAADKVNRQYEYMQQVSDKAQSVAAGIEESDAAVGQVVLTINHLQERAERLKTLVSRFRI